MKWRNWAILLAMPLWACASQPSSGNGASSANGPSPLGLLATPFYLAFKTIDCAASVPTLLPSAVASSVVPFDKNSSPESGWDYYANGVKGACSPPYVAKPASG